MGMIKLDLSDFYYKYEKYLDSVLYTCFWSHMCFSNHLGKSRLIRNLSVDFIICVW